MALTIVRNDIVEMHVDAIVNSTNEHFRPGGVGVDASIHEAAGPMLAEALKNIGHCSVGSAVITRSYDLHSCRYIIHTVGPTYVNGRHGEEEQLRSCYQNILALAKEYDCQSIAIPSISSGAYGYPKDKAYRVATSCIREFLFSLPDDEDMMIYLVLLDQKSVDFSRNDDSAEVQEFVQPSYEMSKKSKLGSLFGGSNRSARPSGRKTADDMVLTSAEISSTARPSMAISSRYADQDLSFADMCEWWCDQKGLSKKEFYIFANINKSMFWNMKHHPDQIPKKTNVLACAIGLRLNYDQTQDLLMRAGMTLSKYYALDVAVERFIRQGNYDIYEINEKLFEKDLPLLGAC